MKTELLPFTSELIPDAGRLLAKRHTRHRKTLPLLPERFEEFTVAAQAVETLWQNNQRTGSAAFCNGRMVAYLIGETTIDPWGRSGYVYLPGYAVDQDENPAILQDLYARLGDDWVKNGCFNHYLYISAGDPDVIAAVFDLGFGKERVDALLDLRTVEFPNIVEPEGLTVRRARQGDGEHLGSVAYVMIDALCGAPYWLPIPPEERPEFEARWAKRANDPEWKVWMAVEQGQTLGTVAFVYPEEDDTEMLISSRTVYLGTAATKPEEQNRGIANILTWRGLEEARRQGFEVCFINWISSNLLASRYWPRFGFKEAAYRLSKRVNSMIAWAKG